MSTRWNHLCLEKRLIDYMLCDQLVAGWLQSVSEHQSECCLGKTDEQCDLFWMLCFDLTNIHKKNEIAQNSFYQDFHLNHVWKCLPAPHTHTSILALIIFHNRFTELPCTLYLVVNSIRGQGLHFLHCFMHLYFVFMIHLWKTEL